MNFYTVFTPVAAYRTSKPIKIRRGTTILSSENVIIKMIAVI